jgi:translation initiation factor 1 (eIF-1/SUI1)
VRDGVLEFQGDQREQLSSLLAKEGIRTRLAGG